MSSVLSVVIPGLILALYQTCTPAGSDGLQVHKIVIEDQNVTCMFTLESKDEYHGTFISKDEIQECQVINENDKNCVQQLKQLGVECQKVQTQHMFDVRHRCFFNNSFTGSFNVCCRGLPKKTECKEFPQSSTSENGFPLVGILGIVAAFLFVAFMAARAGGIILYYVCKKDDQQATPVNSHGGPPPPFAPTSEDWLPAMSGTAEEPQGEWTYSCQSGVTAEVVTRGRANEAIQLGGPPPPFIPMSKDGLRQRYRTDAQEETSEPGNEDSISTDRNSDVLFPAVDYSSSRSLHSFFSLYGPTLSDGQINIHL